VRWQSDALVRETKERVRARDGERCVVCSLDAGTHKKRYGKTLEVHRIVPGSEYSMQPGVCVTLCVVCHDALHGQGAWGWIAKEDPADEEDMAWRVRRSTRADIKDERGWRQREVWGGLLREIRRSVAKRSQAALAILVGVSNKTIRDWEAGRTEPLLSEAMRLAKVLEITLDELCEGQEDEPDEWWLESAEKRSDARALAFRAREAREGETLGRGAAVVWEIVRQADEQREKAREAERKQVPMPLRGRRITL
jgi:DNA-binding XRE family transcriptional regulator